MNENLENIYIHLCADIIDNEKIILLIKNCLDKTKEDQLKFIKFYILMRFYEAKMFEESGYLYILYNDAFAFYGENVYKISSCVNMKKEYKEHIPNYITLPVIKYQSIKLNYIKLIENLLYLSLNDYRIGKNKMFLKCEVKIIIDKIKYLEELFDKKTNDEILHEYTNIISKHLRKICKKLESLDIFKDISIDNIQITI